MKRLCFAILLLTIWLLGTKGQDTSFGKTIKKGTKSQDIYSGNVIKIGIRFLSLQSFNDALKHENLTELNTSAANIFIGKTWESEKNVFNYGIVGFSTYGSDDLNRSIFWGWGISQDFVYKIWKNDKMSLYPYSNLSFKFPQFRTHQKTDANSFGTVYQQTLVDRTFTNNGESNLALGLTYRIKMGKENLLGIGGGYHFRLWQGKWYYAGNTVSFPKVDCRGWEIEITWISSYKKRINDKKSQ
jgi:hypothetical protein